MKTYREKFNINHIIIYVMSVLLFIVILAVWIIKGTMSIQALAGYFIVLGYALTFYCNQSYVIVQHDRLIIAKGKNGYRKVSFDFSNIISLRISKYATEYCLEIDMGSVVHKEKVSLLGRKQINELSRDLLALGVNVLENQ